MAELLTHVCDGITGDRVDTIPASARAYSRLLSAGDSGSQATIPLDGSFGKTALKALLQPWRYMLGFERDGAIEYMGYIHGRGYSRGTSAATVALGDLWSLMNARLAVDHSAPHVEEWSQTVVGVLGVHLNAALVWARDSYAGLPDATFPLTIPGVPVLGPSVTRTYYGYHLPTVTDHLNELMEQGLDVYFLPGWGDPGKVGWLTMSGLPYGSGVTREFSVTADQSPVTGFSEAVDGIRMMNNSIRVGEGSEVDMLTISNLDTLSPLPLLERVTQSKTVISTSQLSMMAGQDLVTFGQPTVQWDLKVTADTPVEVGDTLRLHFDGDPWIDDGFYTRRVVKISGDMSDTKTVGVQPAGGA